MPPPPYVLWKGEARCPECFAFMGEPHGNGLPKAPNDTDDSHPCAVGLYIEQVEARVQTLVDTLRWHEEREADLRAQLAQVLSSPAPKDGAS